MIGLQRDCEINLEGLVKIHFAKIADIESFDVIHFEGNQQKSIQFKGSKNWVPALFVLSKNAWREQSIRSSQGIAYRQTLEGVLPGLSIPISAKLRELENHQFILKIEDISGRPRIVGTLDAPFEIKTSLTTSGVKGHKITFSAKTKNKALGFNPKF